MTDHSPYETLQQRVLRSDDAASSIDRDGWQRGLQQNPLAWADEAIESACPDCQNDIGRICIE